MNYFNPKILAIFVCLIACTSLSAQERHSFSTSEYREISELSKGVYGYNPYISIEANQKHYADMGYTMSYKVKDSTIYIIGGLIIVMIGAASYWFDNRNKSKGTVSKRK